MTPSCFGPNAPRLNAPKQEENRSCSHEYSKFLLSVTSSITRELVYPTSPLFLCDFCYPTLATMATGIYPIRQATIASVSLDHINIIIETIKVVRNAQEATWAPDQAGSLSTMKEEVTEALEKLTAQNFDPDNVALIAQDVDRFVFTLGIP